MSPPTPDAPADDGLPYREFLGALRASRMASSWLEPGAVLGGYVVECLLARGGMASVYQARETALGGRPVALKVLAVDASDERGRQLFLREARLLAGVEHAHLATLYAAGTDGDWLYLAMRLEPGPSLEQAFGPRGMARPPRRDVVRWGLQVSEALAAVHRAGLVHRDVKPANIVLRMQPGAPWAEADAVLVDFGLARRRLPAQDSVTGNDGATPSYAAPEQLLGGSVGPQADVFSLGVTLHDLLSGRVGMRSDRAAQGLPPLSHFDPEADRDLQALLAMAADPDPAWRHFDGDELARDLRAWLDGRPVRARRRTLLERMKRGLARHPGKVLGGLAGLIVVTLAGWGVLEAAVLRSAAEAAEGAVADGDLQVALEAAGRVPVWLQGVLLDEAGSGGLVRRVRTASPGDAVTGLVCALATTPADVETVSLLAVLGLHRSAPPDARVLMAFVASTLEGRGWGADGGARLALARRLAVMACDLPDLDAAGAIRSAPLARACRSIWEGPDASTELRHYATSVTAGLGSGGDVLALVDRLSGLEFGDEQQRLLCEAARLVLRRAPRLGPDGAVDRSSLQARAAGLARVWLQTPGWALDLLPWDSAFAAHRFLLEVVLDGRRVGQPVDPTDWAPPEWLDALSAGSAVGVGTLPHLLAAAGDPRVVSWLARVEGWCGSPFFGSAEEELGWLSGVVGTDSLIDELGRRLDGACSFIPDRFATERFAGGVAAGRDDRLGSVPTRAADPDEPLHRLAPAALSWSRGDLSGADEVARWEAQAGRFTAGWADGLLAAGVSDVAADDGDRFLRFDAAGGAWLELRLTVARPVLDAVLVLRDQVAARWTLPGCGEVKLEVLFDGEHVGADRVVNRVNSMTHEVPLPARELLPGAHVITLLSGSDSTAAYRLLGASLRVGG